MTDVDQTWQLKAYRNLIIHLIEAFLKGRISVEDFKPLYIWTFHVQPAFIDEPLFRIVDELFFAVDAYSPFHPPDEDDPLSVGEYTLRRFADEALKQLKTLAYDHLAAADAVKSRDSQYPGVL